MFLALPLSAQDSEPIVSKERVSVHTVERGNMPLMGRATGSIISLEPNKAIMRIVPGDPGPCKTGQKASVQIDAPNVITAEVVAVRSGQSAGNANCEVKLTGSLPADAIVGKKVEGLIGVGSLSDVIFLARPALSSANSQAYIFVLEPGGEFAHRTTVRYGVLSGPLIQVEHGLLPGDRVIVTDTSKWETSQRIRLK
jgi:HlyD family secretion protein